MVTSDKESPARSNVSSTDGSSAQYHFGQELRRRRLARGLSSQALAEQVGLTASDLDRLETTATWPPLSVLWKIANSLNVPFAQLLGRRTPVASLARHSDVEVLQSRDGKVQSRPMVTTALCRWVEVYEITIGGDTHHIAEAHARGTEEIVVVKSGALSIRIDEEAYDLLEGDSVTFLADVAHVYENRGRQAVTFYDIIVYAR